MRAYLGRGCRSAGSVNQLALHYGPICEPIQSLMVGGVASDVETVVGHGKIVMDNRHIPDVLPLRTLLGQAQAFANQY